MKVIQPFLLGLAALTATQLTQAAVSIVATEDKGGTFYYTLNYNEATPVDAKKKAMADCKAYAKKARIKNNCREVLAHSGPTYFAVLENAPGKAASVGFSIATSRQEAIDEAYDRCRQSGQYECKNHAEIVAWDGGPERLPEPHAVPKAVAQPVKTQTVNSIPTLQQRVDANREALSPRGKDIFAR